MPAVVTGLRARPRGRHRVTVRRTSGGSETLALEFDRSPWVRRRSNPHGKVIAVSNREWLSVALWVGALGIWIVAGVLGDLSWWLVTIVVIAFGLQVVNAVRLALKGRSPQPDA